jgi:SAM-dependent methyltransferase
MLQSSRNAVGQRILKIRKQRLTAEVGEPTNRPYTTAGDSILAAHTTHYSQSRHLPVWESICERIPMGSRILEVGCGVAHFAHLLMDRRIPGAYVGFDLSTAAVAMAKARLPECRVEVDDARATDLFTSVQYDVVVCTEVLGHIVDDVPVIERIPREKHVLATVPSFDDVHHVRFFAEAGEVRDRYRCLFSSLEVSKHQGVGDPNEPAGTVFLLDGVR